MSRRGPADQAVGHLRILHPGHRDHRADHRVGQQAAMDLLDLPAQGSLGLFREILAESQGRGPFLPKASQPFFGQGPNLPTGQAGGPQRQPSPQGRGGDGLVMAPIRPATLGPAHRRADAGGAFGMVFQMSVQRGLLGPIQHLERHRRATALCDHALQQPGLQPVMIRVVVLLPQQNEPRASKRRDQCVGVRKASAVRLPDFSDQRMVAQDLRLPGRDRGLGLRGEDAAKTKQ